MDDDEICLGFYIWTIIYSDRNEDVDPFHWSLFVESSNEDVIGTMNMFIETSPQYDDNDDSLRTIPCEYWLKVKVSVSLHAQCRIEVFVSLPFHHLILD